MPATVTDAKQIESALEACRLLEKWSRDKNGGANLEALIWTIDLQDAVMTAREALEAKGKEQS